MKLWNWIERHHEQFGAALFVIPALVLPVALAGLVTLMGWLW